MRLLMCLVVFAALSSLDFANTIWVPDDHPTIQAAIAAAGDGDEIIVRPGTYFENVDFIGKAITVQSEMGPGVTTIDGGAAGSVVIFLNGEGAGSVLDGFTVMNGSTTYGGGIYCSSSSPTITNNTISGNMALAGGGIYCLSSSPTITNNTITGNTVGDDGGGICCFLSSTPTITNNTITDNLAGVDGGGVYCSTSGSSPTITNSTITGNTAYTGGGICCRSSASATITNTILWDNNASSSPEICGNVAVTYSCIKGGWSGSGNINTDPIWVDPANDDYRLQQDPCQPGVVNPCVDTGDPAFSMIAGTTRTDWVQDAGMVDMGYHYRILASATFRNAGTNPASYAAATDPTLGSNYIATIAVGGTTGHDFALLVGYATPFTVTLGGGQTILVNVADPNGELLTQPMLSGPIAIYNLPVPSDIALVGFALSTQALHVGGVQPFALSNAQDLILGY